MQIQILDGCIVCGVCEQICPEVFTVTESTSVANNDMVPGMEAKCHQAARLCPVQVIQIAEE